MNLLYTLTAYPPYIGGAQLHQHFLGQHLLERHSVQVLCHWSKNRTDWLLGTTLTSPSKDYDYSIDKIPVHRISLNAIDKLRLAPIIPLYYFFMAEALSYINQVLTSKISAYAKSADLIHNVRIGREGLSYTSLSIARRYNIPFIFTPVHHPRWIGWRYKEYLKLYKEADCLIALTNAEKSILIDLGIKEDRIAVTGHGPILAPTVCPESFFSRYSNIEAPFVLFLGQHYLYKGYRQILEAAPLVWQNYPEVHFVFIGPGVKNSEHVFDNSDYRIHRLGSVDLQTKTDAIAACTMLCVPSTQESFGGVYTEAWSLGKPVIGCAIPAVSEVVTNGVDGYLVSQEPSQIADRICHLLNYPLQAEMMGSAGQTKVAQKYTWERIAEKTELVYQKFVNK